MARSKKNQNFIKNVMKDHNMSEDSGTEKKEKIKRKKQGDMPVKGKKGK